MAGKLAERGWNNDSILLHSLTAEAFQPNATRFQSVVSEVERTDGLQRNSGCFPERRYFEMSANKSTPLCGGIERGDYLYSLCLFH
jgi:hypothetical protein